MKAFTPSLFKSSIFAPFIILVAGSLHAQSVNLIENPSVETASANASIPQGWARSNSGSGTTTFSYLTTGQSGSRSIKVQRTRNNGESKWYFTPVSVNAGVQYTFSDYYQSNIASQVVARFDDGTGKYTTQTLASLSASSTWKQVSVNFTVPAGQKLLTIFHRITRSGWLTTDNFVLTAPIAPTPPTVSVTGPQTGASVNGNIALTANASDTLGVANVQFKVDGVNVGSADTTSPYSVTWNSTTVANGSHTITAVATNTSNLQTTSASVQVNVNNVVVTPPTPPTVSITAPQAGTVVSGNLTLTANASDTIGVASVQFQVDGNNVGNADTSSPYSIVWNSTAVMNGTHSLTAIAANTSGLSTTSSPVEVSVNNVTMPTGNLILNPSVETVNPSSSTSPQYWNSGKWGTNSATFSYLNTGRTGSRSVKTQVTSYSSGAAYWIPNSVAVTGGQTYKYTDYYASNVTTEVGADITMSNGSVQYMWFGQAGASPDTWSKFEAQVSVPVGAVSMVIIHDIYSVGWLTVDDASFAPYTPSAFARPIVSIQFDDGYKSIYDNGVPLVEKYGFLSTQFIITGTMDADSDYMTKAQVLNLFQRGHDIQSHTVSHAHLPTLSASALDAELKNSQAALQTLLGVPVVNLATPYGESNAAVIANAKLYYATVRGVQPGLNTPDNFNPYNLLAKEVQADTPLATVQAWIQEAIAAKAWLILFYHRVDPGNVGTYNRKPADLDADLSYLKSTGVTVLTTSQALSEISQQLP